MSNPRLFPASKIRQIVSADPDVKDISKQSIEVLRQASQLFAHSLFTKCSEEARRHKRQTSNIRDFLSVVSEEDPFHVMLSQFLLTSPPPSVEEEEQQDEPDDVIVESEIEDLLRGDPSDSSSS
jgi:histone H3/H4